MTHDSSQRAAASHSSIIRMGGLSLIGAAVAFLAVFAYLAARFNYPEVLDGRASDVLPALLKTGHGGRVAWALYSLLPLFWIPAAVGAFHWIGYAGIVTGVAGLIGMFRNVTGAVSVVAEMNNYLLPAWMIVFGISLLRFAAKPSPVVLNPAPVAA